MGKVILYYTDNRLEEPIYSMVQNRLSEIGLPITSVSLKPIDFGENIVLSLSPGIITMTAQILMGLKASKEDVIFLTEHDVLYHKSHFDFTPKEDKFYYNTNVYRWDYPYDRLITYNHLRSLSGLCTKRELLIDYYTKRLELIEKNGWQDTSREPKWIRKLGHETKENSEDWKSEYPNIDIRHKGTITRRKVRLVDFRKQPTNWQETTMENIKGWNLVSLFPVVTKFS